MTYQNLVIDHKDQEIIRAISHPQVSDWKLDFIQGKGEGQIVLLHGSLSTLYNLKVTKTRYRTTWSGQDLYCWFVASFSC